MQVACSYKSFKTFLRKIHQTAGNLKFKYETSEQKSKKNSKKMNKKKKLYKKKKEEKKCILNAWPKEDRPGVVSKKNLNE